MAAATVTGRQRNRVFGDRRFIGADSVAFANSGDTWTVPGIKKINALLMTPTGNSSYGFTISGSTITLVSGGAVTFLGGVIGI